MGMAWILAGILALGLGGYRVARTAFGLPRGLPAAFGAFVLAWAWESLGTLGLGLAGWLARGPLLAWAAVGLGIAWLATRSSPRAGDEAEPGPPGRFGPEGALAIGLGLWAFLSLLVPSLVLPVKVVSDGPIYHLYFAARWIQEGRIFLVPTPFGETAAPYFPAVGDLWLTWLFALGGERPANVGQVPFFLIEALVVYDLARRAGTRPAAAAIATCWFVTSAPMLVFSVEPIVDTIFHAGYLLAVWFAARYLRDEGGVGSLALAGLAAGGAWGTKAPGIVFVPPLVVLIAVAVALRPGPTAKKVRNVVVLALSTLVLEAFWPARNAWLTGNPVYPLEVSAFGRVVFPGWYGRGAMASSRYYAPIWYWRVGADIALSIFDPRLFPAWFAALAGAWKLGQGPRRGDRLAWACAGLAVLNLALYWLVIPYRSQFRFALHGVALAAVPLARLLDRSRLMAVAGAALLALHVFSSQEWPADRIFAQIPWKFTPLVPSPNPAPIKIAMAVVGWWSRSLDISVVVLAEMIAAGLASLAAGALTVWAARGPWRRWAAPAAAAVLATAILCLAATSRITEQIFYRYPDFRDFLAGWAELESRVGRTPVRIAYAGTNLPYYLMGPDFANRVSYVNVDAHRGWLLHDYHRAAASMGQPTTWHDTRPGWDRLRSSDRDWIANLDAEGIQLLVVTRADPLEGDLNPYDAEGFPIERTFADVHPERFAPLAVYPRFRLYAVKPPPKNRAGPTDRATRSHY